MIGHVRNPTVLNYTSINESHAVKVAKHKPHWRTVCNCASHFHPAIRIQQDYID